jgi:hypothetical protein
MKTATLIALILCVLEMLIQALGLSAWCFQLHLNNRDFGIAIYSSNVLFAASLSYFFMILYKNQKS